MSATVTEAEAGAPTEPHTGRLPAGTLFMALAIVGLVVRVLALRSNWGMPDADEATGMVMAQRAAHGHLSVFFWGANYGGALITWIEAPLVRLFGLHVVVFQVVDTALSFVVALLTRAVATRLVSRAAADLAGGLCWILSPAWVFWSSREYVFWVPGMIFALATVLFCLRTVERRSRFDPYLVGLFLGAAYWIYPLYLALLAPPGLLFVWSQRRNWRNLARTAVTAPAGGIFWIVANLRHNFESLHHPIAAHQTGSVIARHSITEVLPASLSAIPHPQSVFPTVPAPPVGDLRWIGMLTFGAAVVWTLGLLAARRPQLAVVGACLLVWPLVVAASGVFVDPSAYRYGLVLTPAIALMVAWLADRFRPVVIATAVGACCLSVVTVGHGTRWFAAVPSCPVGLTQVGHYLEASGRTAVWSSYWAGTPLEVCTDDRVVASPTSVDRDVLAHEKATSAPKATFVVFPGALLDQSLTLWQAGHPDAAATRHTIGGLAVWTFESPETPTSLGLPASTL